jgi:apolipoprotein N-acyltransferase
MPDLISRLKISPILTGKRGLLTSFVSGAICVLAHTPFDFIPAFFLGIALFYISLSHSTTAKAAALHSWLFGLAYFMFGLYWIGNALLIEGNGYAWAWPLAILGLPAVLAVFTALPGYLAYRLANLKRTAGLFAFVGFFSLFEYARGHIFTGFPWNLFAYVWNGNLAISQISALIGSYGLGLLTLFWAATLGYISVTNAGKFQKTIIVGCAILSLTFSGLYGFLRLTEYAPSRQISTSVRIVQPNIAQKDKWNPDKMAENLRTYIDLSLAHPANQLVPTLIVWPETALTQFLFRHEAVKTALRDMLATYSEQPVYLATGMLQHNENGYRNSLVVFDKNLSKVAEYDKSHLVPFGEYMPLQDIIPLAPVTNFVGFQRGDKPQNLTIPDIGTFSPLICYEVIFSGSVINSPNKPDMIINVTNDGWYGNSTGPHQHLTSARFRAIEEGVGIIRAAGTGISAVIDPVGRITYKAPLETRSGVNTIAPPKIHAVTAYTRYKEHPYLFLLGIMLLTPLIWRIAQQKVQK